MNISVYITSYNQKDYLYDAIESVLNQTLRPFEVLIVDDCSTDGSQEMIRALSSRNPLIKYILTERNLGVANTRNLALSLVTGDFFTYVDGDDIYLPHKLETEAKLLRATNFDVAFSNNLYVDPDNTEDVKWIWAYNRSEMPAPGNMFVETITRKFPRGSLFRMELIDANLMRHVGYYDESLKIYEDYDLRIRLAQKAKINFTLEPTTKIRISKNGLSKTAVEYHSQSLGYIFMKYGALIDGLPEPSRSSVRAEIKGLLRQIGQRGLKGSDSIKSLLKRKLIRLIEKS